MNHFTIDYSAWWYVTALANTIFAIVGHKSGMMALLHNDKGELGLAVSPGCKSLFDEAHLFVVNGTKLKVSRVLIIEFSY